MMHSAELSLTACSEPGGDTFYACLSQLLCGGQFLFDRSGDIVPDIVMQAHISKAELAMPP